MIVYMWTSCVLYSQQTQLHTIFFPFILFLFCCRKAHIEDINRNKIMFFCNSIHATQTTLLSSAFYHSQFTAFLFIVMRIWISELFVSKGLCCCLFILLTIFRGIILSIFHLREFFEDASRVAHDRMMSVRQLVRLYS